MNWLGFGACIAAMLFALYLQYVKGLEPCPLCILQRLSMVGLGIVYLLAALHNPRRAGQRIYGVLKMMAVMAGIVVASRHVWLQQLPPDQVPSCGPGYTYLMENFPLLDALSVIFHGSGECSKIDWTLVGVTLPQLTLAVFVLFLFWELSVQHRSGKRLT